jgi:hypothetical protein
LEATRLRILERGVVLLGTVRSTLPTHLVWLLFRINTRLNANDSRVVCVVVVGQREGEVLLLSICDVPRNLALVRRY